MRRITFAAATCAGAAVTLAVGIFLAFREEERAAKKKKKSGFSFVRRIILVRHGESLGNVDRSAYTRIGDNMIPLTKKGIAQARSRGRSLTACGEIKGAFRVYYSPYLRARQTALELVRGICGGNKSMHSVAMRSDPRLREQDFGNLQSSVGPHAMESQQQARSKFGRFWYRFQNGESGADVYDRIGNFFGTLTRARGLVRDPDGDQLVHAETIVLVTHGLSMRLFLMRYFRWNVSEFEKVWNPRNCERWVLERPNGRVPFTFASFAQVKYGKCGKELPLKMRTVRSAWDTRGWAGVSAHEMLSDEVAKDLEQLALKQDAKGENLSPYDEDEDGDNEIGITIAHQPAQPAVLLRKTSVFA